MKIGYLVVKEFPFGSFLSGPLALEDGKLWGIQELV